MFGKCLDLELANANAKTVIGIIEILRTGEFKQSISKGFYPMRPKIAEIYRMINFVKLTLHIYHRGSNIKLLLPLSTSTRLISKLETRN